MNSNNNIHFENKIYRNKKKIIKTLLVGKFDLDKIISKVSSDTNINYSIVIKKIYLELNDKSNDYGLIESLISKMKILISTNPDPKYYISNIITIPGYICGFRFINSKLLELNIWFENFLPCGLALPIYNIEQIETTNPICGITGKPTYYDCGKNFYLMMLFGSLINDDLIISSYVEYNLAYTNLDNDELYLTLKKKNEMNIKEHFNVRFHFDDFYGHKTIFIQDTQTQNFSSSKINNSKLVAKINFNFMCRGFWIKMHKIDYSNFKKFKIILNGSDRFDVDIFELELLDLDKKYIDDSIVFFFNLELLSKEWGLPKTISKSKLIYSNSLNLSRIDSTKFIFEFESNLLAGEYIGISALNSNLLGIQNIKYEKIFIN